MPSKEAIRSAWTAKDRNDASSIMSAYAGAERQCVKVSGDTITYNKTCFKKAVPKGTGKNLWTE